jgi:hypothetical protein
MDDNCHLPDTVWDFHCPRGLKKVQICTLLIRLPGISIDMLDLSLPGRLSVPF